MIARPQRDVSDVREFGGYSIRRSEEPDDPTWDDFLEQLEQAPGCVCTQTSSWGRARASIGWRSARVVVSEDDRVVAGAQMWTRPMPAGGNVGFVCRGPVIPEGRADLTRLVFDETMAMGRRHGVGYLVIQPPRGGGWMHAEMARRGLRRGAFDIDLTSTVRVDLRADDLDDVFAETGERRAQPQNPADGHGLTVRRGTEADLATFNLLKDAESARLDYARRSEEYYAELWRSLEPRGHVAIFVAEHGATPVSALLTVPFGETCHHIELLWSGQHAHLRPNEQLESYAIEWARSEGYRFTDFEGTRTPVAKVILTASGIASSPAVSDPRSALAFGAQMIFDPPAFDYVYHPVLRTAYRCVPIRVMRSARMGALLSRFRGAGS